MFWAWIILIWISTSLVLALPIASYLRWRNRG